MLHSLVLVAVFRKLNGQSYSCVCAPCSAWLLGDVSRCYPTEPPASHLVWHPSALWPAWSEAGGRGTETCLFPTAPTFVKGTILLLLANHQQSEAGPTWRAKSLNAISSDTQLQNHLRTCCTRRNLHHTVHPHTHCSRKHVSQNAKIFRNMIYNTSLHNHFNSSVSNVGTCPKYPFTHQVSNISGINQK